VEREVLSEVQGVPFMLWNDLRFACRQLHKSPGFALAIIVTLALGIGVNTAVFSMIDGFLLRSLPYPQPDRVAALMLHQEGNGAVEERNHFERTTWVAIRDNVPAVEVASTASAIGAEGEGINLTADRSAGGGVFYVHGASITAHYFDVLGIRLLKGRGFTPEEGRAHGPKAVIISYGLWQSAFHGDPDLAGRAIHLKGEPYTVVGILPRGATTPNPVDLWTPLVADDPEGQCGGTNCRIFMRLKPGANWEQVTAQLKHMPFPSFLNTSQAHMWFYARPLATELANTMHSKVEVLMLAVSFILLIACANLAGLALVRISRRTPEIATRLALGASRAAVLRQLWIENLLLALIGAGAGLLLARLILTALQQFLLPTMIPVGGFTMDARVLAFTFGASLLTSLLFGALPAMQTRRVDLRSAIALGSKAIVGGSSRLRQVLIAAEIALTVILLTAAGVLVHTLIHLETLPPGFDATNVMTAKASLDDARYHDPGAFQSLLQKSLAAMRRIPGVEDAAVGLSVPYETFLNSPVAITDGKLASSERVASSVSYVTPGYFSTLRIPVLAGRVFTDGDTATSQAVAIVNASFGKHFYNDASPIGRHFKDGETVYTIVGVVGDIQDQSNVERDAPLGTEPIYYEPAARMSEAALTLVHTWFQPSWIVRTHGPIQGLTNSMRKALAAVDPNLPFSGFYSMSQILDEQLQEQRIEVLLYTTLALLALLLSAIGIYSLVSNLVVQRTREIGIRMAFGSTIGQAMRHIGSAGLVAAAAGMVAGIALSFMTLRLLASELYGVETYDPATLITVPLLLALIALGASFFPTLRISRIQPADTLRTE
jgi:predicted permease